MAVERAGIAITREIDFIIFATITPDYFLPGNGVLLQRELGLTGHRGPGHQERLFRFYLCPLRRQISLLRPACTKPSLVVGAEIQSSALDKSDAGRSSAVIFRRRCRSSGPAGCGCRKNSGILSTHLHADGDYAEELYVRDPGSSRESKDCQHQLIESGSFQFIHERQCGV
jgi:3-oxoacyl-[acyl-carrier-protein] synthase III